jgi:hypothetical protein
MLSPLAKNELFNLDSRFKSNIFNLRLKTYKWTYKNLLNIASLAAFTVK